MKIVVLKSGNTKTKAMSCPFFVDAPPDGVDTRNGSDKK